MPTHKWKMEGREHCFVVGREGRKPNIKIVYGDTTHNIPLFGDKEEARAIAVIIEHAMNGTFLVNPGDARKLASAPRSCGHGWDTRCYLCGARPDENCGGSPRTGT